MTWARLCDRAHANPKLRRVGLAGTGLHMLAISWCASEETDGHVPRSVVPMLAPELSAARRRALVGALVDAGLWEESEGGWRVHDYLAYNPSRSELAAKRERERERIAARRSTG